MLKLNIKPFRNLTVSKKRKKDEEFIKKTGIEIKEVPVLDENKKLYFILTNALINFLIVFGMTGLFIKSFDIKCYMPIVFIFSMFTALFMSLLYYNMAAKIIGYFICLVAFIYGIINLRYMIKGGFGYISNTLMAFFEKELDLPIERSYSVYGYGEKKSVTVCLIFIIFAIMLLFNMIISEIKGFVFTFLTTFPIAQMGMYFGQKTDMLYFIIYMIGLLGIFFLRNSKHYHMEYKKKKGYKKTRKKNRIIYDYTNDGKNSLSFVIILGILIIVISTIGSIAFPQKKYKANSNYDEWRDGTKDFTKQLIMVGFWGMISPNGGSAGGVGRNRLGQSKYVRLDYETDLIVRMPVYTGESSTYFKSFIGTFYRDEYWQTISENKENKIKLENYGLNSDDILNLQGDIINICRLSRRYDSVFKSIKDIEIVNVNAFSGYMYVPYNDYTLDLYSDVINDDEYVGRHRTNKIISIRYYPFADNFTTDEFREYIKVQISNIKEIIDISEELTESEQDKEKILQTEEKYSEYVYDMYMDVPEKNEKVIKEFCENYGLTRDSENIVEKLAEIFQNDYTYTLMPGVTPSDKDFVNYFLTKQKKGYCTYFATSATLILRYLGIPARYAGGYVLQSADYQSGMLTDGLLYPEDTVNSEYADVYEYELNDSQAHAWVEIYIDGFGWIPVEVTPSSDEDIEEPEQENTNLIADFFANQVFTKETFNAVKNTTVNMIYLIITVFICVVIIYIGIGMYIRRHRINKNVVKVYDYLCKVTKCMGINKAKEEDYLTFGKKLVKEEIISLNDMNRINEILEKEKFSKNNITAEEIKEFNDIVANVAENVYLRLKRYKKIYFRYIKWL